MLAKIIKRVVKDKAVNSVYSQVHLSDGKAHFSDGNLYACSPAPYTGEPVTVNGRKLADALEVDGVDLSLKGDTLSVSGSKFRFRLPASTEAYPVFDEPDDWGHSIDGEKLISTLRRLKRYMSNDPNRMSINAIAVIDGYAYATTNIVLARCKIDGVPDMVIPYYAVNEITRLDDVDGLTTDGNSIFFRNRSVWYKAQTIAASFPRVDGMIKDGTYDSLNTAELSEALNVIRPFVGPSGIVDTGPEGLSSGGNDSARYAVDLPESRWHIDVLTDVLAEATQVSLSSWPEPVRWSGDGIQGVAIGVK